jgi:hypothetical protein
MHHLTNSATWLERAMEASQVIAASPALSDPAMGQSIGLLAYPSLKLAYESAISSPAHAESAQVFLDAALIAASTLARMYVRIPGVIKVRPTSNIAAEAAHAGVATISPFAVFSTVEGSAAATGLLEWASTLPGGKNVWHDIAVRNAKRIAADHISSDGTVQGALVYSSLSSTTAPKALSSPHSSNNLASVNTATEAVEAVASFVQGVMETMNGHVSSQPAAPSDDSSSATSAGDAMDSWLSSIGGQTTNNGLRQALGTITMIEAARATTTEDIELSSYCVKAAEASALSLLALSSPSTSASYDSLSSAAAASALAQLSTLPTLTKDRSAEYSDAAKSILSKLFTVASGTKATLTSSAESSDDQTLGSIASKFFSNILKSTTTTSNNGPRSILLPAVGEEAEADDISILNEEADLQLTTSNNGLITEEDISSVSSEEKVGGLRQKIVSQSILPNGSMLGDQMLLQALTLLS